MLELLVVLTLMGIAGALVVPVFRPRSSVPDRNDVTIISAARQTAVRRAEPLRLNLFANGSWLLAAQRDGAVVDSGHVTGELPAADLLVDALGGCVPAAQAQSREFDPLSCSFVDGGARP